MPGKRGDERQVKGAQERGSIAAHNQPDRRTNPEAAFVASKASKYGVLAPIGTARIPGTAELGVMSWKVKVRFVLLRILMA